MTRILAMHQPNWLPWIGYFHKMARSDVFVLLDNVQVPRGRSYASRTRIKTPNGPRWLTLPLPHRGTRHYRTQPLLEQGHWLDDITGMLYHNYARAPYWDYAGFSTELEWAANNCATLAELNGCLIGWAAEALNIDAGIMLQSELSNRRGLLKENLPAWLCKQMKCDVYLSGQGARCYNQPHRFRTADVELRYQRFDCPEYPQPWGEFVPNLSVVDFIFNCGPEAGAILTGELENT